MLHACSSRSSLLLVGIASIPMLVRKHEEKSSSRCDDRKTLNATKLDDCFNPACHSTMDLLKKMNMNKKLPKVINKKPKNESNPYCTGCPADKNQLGRGTWDLIHAIAATYPEKPSKDQQHHTDAFLRSLSMVYPCPYCATHFQKRIAASPPRYKYASTVISSYLHL